MAAIRDFLPIKEIGNLTFLWGHVSLSITCHSESSLSEYLEHLEVGGLALLTGEENRLFVTTVTVY